MSSSGTRAAAAAVITLAAIAFGWCAAGFTAPSQEKSSGAPSPADIAFCQDMAAHHDQAVLMSVLAQDRAGPTVKAIAASILVAQSQETGILRGWLQLWGQPPVDLSPASRPQTGKYCLAPRGGAMPGMASPQQLNQLWRSSGNAFDILFLQLMIRHHQGGLLMSREARLQAKLDVVRTTAQAMLTQQTQEIADMRRLLQVAGADPLPSPE